MEIIGSLKTYDWGKLGLSSEVAQLFKLNSPSFIPDNNTPYAELWLGDHPSGPSKLKATGEDLGTFLSKDRGRLIGGHQQLPFLLKVLSIRKALSIQVHPDKAEAEKLHSTRPDVYKDANHKPELAVALTPFLALCGFRPYKEIQNFCTKFTPIKLLLGDHKVEKLNSAGGLKECFESLMTSTQERIDSCIQQIEGAHAEELKDSGLFEIFNTINKDFPNDVGILSLFFLNVIRLQPGEAVFLPANEPHAYLRGDVIECMACSDNVIRAGLTPKYKDVPTLIRLLNYEGHPPEKKLFQAIKKDAFLDLFIPGVKDFAVARLALPQAEECYKWKNGKFGSILIVLHGERTLRAGKYGYLELARGSAVFIPADCDEVDFISKEGGAEEFTAYIAMYNDF